MSYPYELQTCTESHSYPRQCSFLLQKLGHMFPVNVIFSAFFGIFRVPSSYEFLYGRGACFTKYLISKLNLNETQLVMKAMLKTTSTSVFVIETSIRNLPLVFLSKALFEHISLLNEEFTCNNSLISTISYTFKYVYTFRVYVYTILFSVLHHSGCTTWASVKHDCLVCIQ